MSKYDSETMLDCLDAIVRAMAANEDEEFRFAGLTFLLAIMELRRAPKEATIA